VLRIDSRIWLNADPIGIAGGLNLYAYAGSNPINFIDPSGLLFGVGVNEAYNNWINAGGDALNRGGILGALQAAAATAAMASIDFFGARTLENNAEMAGRASAAGCTGKTIKYGGLAVGQIAFVAGGQYAVNAVAFPFIRFIGLGSNPGFGAGTWLARAVLGETPYGSIENAASALQIPPASEVDSAVNATSNVWYKYVAGPRTVSGNPQWGAGGGQEYRVGGFGNP
jgi:hypothetical protein